MGKAIGGSLPLAVGIAVSPIPIIAVVLMLAGLKDWMSAYNGVIMSVLCLIIAAKLIGDAISSLAG